MKVSELLEAMKVVEDKYKGKTFEQHVEAFNKGNKEHGDGEDYEWEKDPKFGKDRGAWSLDDQAIVGTILAKATNFSDTVLVYVDMALEERENRYGETDYKKVAVGPFKYHALDTSQWQKISNEWM